MNRSVFGILRGLLCLLTPALMAATDTMAAAPVPAGAHPAARPALAAAGPRYLDGYVLGADGLALPGVTARVVGSSHIVVSNADGMFRLPLPATGGQPLRVVCSYLGLADCEVVLAPRQRVMSLEMVEHAQQRAVRRAGR